MNPALVEIGIATRNRWKDLHDTLERLAAFGLGRQHVLIFDDGSDSCCPYDVKAICLGAELQRFNESAGYIVRRNQLARSMTARYYLSLDDDSFPVSGSLADALAFADTCDDLFCLGFPVYNPVTGQHQVMSLQEQPYKVRSFIGCGHLLRRDCFLELGGYCEELVHQGEEGEIAVRAFQRGKHCYHFPGLQIHHTESNVGRNHQRVDYYGARNAVLWNDWYLPPRLRNFRHGRALISRLWHSMKVRRWGQLQGYWAGLKEIPHYKRHRHSMNWAMYRQWNCLPYH